MRRAERLFGLVSELRRRGVTRARDLAEHLEVSTRSVYRDIAHLQASGLPIDGEAGVGYVLRPGFDLPAMTFTYEQIDALAIRLAFAEAAGDPALAAAAREVRAKVQASLPGPDTGQLEDAPLFVVRRDGPTPRFAEAIRRAIRDRAVLRLGYRSGEDRTSERRVRPLAVWAFGDGWLFVAWCELRGDFRAFRIDRIEALADTGERFEDAPERSLATYLATRMPA